jgi:hypothetical protein
MKRKIYRIQEEFPSIGDLFQTRVNSRNRILQFYRMNSKTVWLTDGKRVYERKPEEVRAVRIDKKLLLNIGFRADGERYVFDCDNLHFEAYKQGSDMVIVITTEGESRKTYVCCDFLHELQHLKRLEIAGIKLPKVFSLNYSS